MILGRIRVKVKVKEWKIEIKNHVKLVGLQDRIPGKGLLLRRGQPKKWHWAPATISKALPWLKINR